MPQTLPKAARAAFSHQAIEQKREAQRPCFSNKPGFLLSRDEVEAEFGLTRRFSPQTRDAFALLRSLDAEDAEAVAQRLLDEVQVTELV